MASKSEQKKLYIAYGSNLNLSQMEMRCPTATVMGPGKIEGYELLFRGVATVEPKKGGRVPVLLWNISPRDEAALDRYEGWPHLYRKEIMDVEMEGNTISAMVYVMNDIRSLSLPTENYYKAIENGYKTSGFDTAILEQALASTLEKMDQEETPWRQLSTRDAPDLHL
ncbi:gamma-glutamylcyclotransferase family protein [Hungatella effluvii]|uniref:gamma-glutamylcyclotransferase family protein n=1 Tax=Hungatella effluvii TaxID=1096246 RepID=UPI0022DF7739|nr:gamma-glutamylcyclotransferase family protein [Hungatella effluvii]